MRRSLKWIAGGALLLAAFALELRLSWGGSKVAAVIDNLAELASAALATFAAAWRARRCRGRLRLSWAAIGVGTGGWTIGQAIWSYYELIANRETPFPSLADAGYLTFPVFALAGLLLLPAACFAKHGRIRVVLDSVLVAASLFVLSWVTAVGEVLHAASDSRFAMAVSLAYPVGDILLLTVTLVVITHAVASARFGLTLLASGFAALCVADSGFAYMTAANTYGTGSVIDAGWVAGFAVLAVAAFKANSGNELGVRGTVSNTALLMPYFPAGLAIALAGYRVRGHHADNVSLGAAVVIICVLFARQLLVLRDNRGLVTVITQQAFYDALTGLANRSLFTDRLEHALDLHRRDMRQLAVLFIDLDDFKLVNDGLGHAIGDDLLVRVAERLRGTLRPGDTLARLGGDEFAVLLEDGGEPVVVAERMRTTLQEPFPLNGHQVLARASIGIAGVTSEVQTPTAAEIMVNADVAMYRAKRAGKNDLCLYQPGMSHDDAPDFAMSAALDAAIAAGDIRAEYQAIVDLASGRIDGWEALARWRFEGQDIPPVVFIPIAERRGLISALTDHMLQTACAQLATWNASAAPGHVLHMGVNVPPALLADQHFPERIAEIIARHRLLPGQLVLEITETGLIDDPATAKQICHRLTAAGAVLSLDDFGTGYSSLAHLRSIPLQSLKIDKAFVDRIGLDEEADELLEAIVTLAHQLRLSVIAEGIENELQLRLLTGLKCELGQGYLLARPQPAERISPTLAVLATTR